MSDSENALPTGGPAKPTQNSATDPKFTYEITSRERLFLPITACFCVLLADTFLWYGPTAGLTAAVFAWYLLLLGYLGPAAFSRPESRWVAAENLLLSVTLALSSNWAFRIWNMLALLVLLPVQAISLSGAGRLPWHRPAMLWERLGLLLWGLFGRLGAAFAALSRPRQGKRAAGVILGIAGSAVLLMILVPVLSSADALFASATVELRRFVAEHLTEGLWKLVLGMILTPFFFGFLYSLRHPIPLTTAPEKASKHADALAFVIILAALALLYLAFLSIQISGVLGGAAYLAQRGISYADWARSGFFQMVAVTAVNLLVLLSAVTISNPAGRSWMAVRLLATLVTVQSLALLCSAAWRMTLYVGAYGFSFKRCMTYWGMVMMAAFLVMALIKCWRPAFSFFRAAFPAALAGWLVINCIPIDYLVARDQVDRYLGGESPSVSIYYLAYDLSYDTLSQLERLDPRRDLADYEPGAWALGDTLGDLLERRRDDARGECDCWQTWSLSACLAAGGEA